MSGLSEDLAAQVRQLAEQLHDVLPKQMAVYLRRRRYTCSVCRPDCGVPLHIRRSRQRLKYPARSAKPALQHR